MTAPSAPNFTFEGASARIRIGTTAGACTKITPPKESIKTEKIRRVGEMVARVRTLGIYEIDGGSLTMESAVFATQILPAVPKNGWSAFEFLVTVVNRHPLVGGPWRQVWDRVRFAGLEQEAIEATEKALQLTLPVDVIQMFHAGADGIYKSLALNPAEPTPAAAAFML